MFEDEDDDLETTKIIPPSQKRYYRRIQKFKDKNKFMPRTQHYFWWIVHNGIAHTLLWFAPVTRVFQFHDWSSRKLNAE